MMAITKAWDGLLTITMSLNEKLFCINPPDMSKEKTTEQRFFEKAGKRGVDECWNWEGSTNFDGYGYIQINLTLYSAHRLSYKIHNGEVPRGMCVLHKCHNRKCCNPNHLKIGTHKDNMQDMVDSGRALRRPGSLNPWSKLTEQQAIDIINSKNSVKELSQKYNIHSSAIYKIKKGKAWTHLATQSK